MKRRSVKWIGIIKRPVERIEFKAIGQGRGLGSHGAIGQARIEAISRAKQLRGLPGQQIAGIAIQKQGLLIETHLATSGWRPLDIGRDC